jgi:pyruvate,water dikinase
MEIYKLNEIPKNKLTEVGGKAKGLCLMAQSGINIAPGFVLMNIESKEDLENAAQHYINSGLQTVAVRSSANAEDGSDFSNAGQYKTVLNVSGEEDFKQSVVECLASLHSFEAESYSSFFNQAKSSKMSVVVQQMVDASKAGVCFTIDPNGDENTLLIEAVKGVGESLVSGHESAKQYTLDKTNLESISTYNNEELLSDRELKEIAEKSLKAVSYFDTHLDMEWAIDAKGNILWLQARPITTSNEIDMHELDPKWDFNNQLTTTCNISEMMPGAVTPLTLSTSVYAIDWGLRKMLISSGVYKNLDEAPEGISAFSIGNHLFLNLTTIGQLSEHVIGANCASIELSICGRIVEHPKDYKEQKLKVNTLKGIRNGIRYIHFILSRNKARKKLTKLANNYQFINQNTIEKQFEALCKAKDVVNLTFLYHYITSAHSGAMSSALNIALSQDIPVEEVRAIIAEALENIDGIESVDILRSLRKIAKNIIEELSGWEDLSQEELLNFLKISNGKSHKSYLYFINRHGHRAVREAEMSSKGWADDEKGFMDYLSTVLSSGGIEPPKSTEAYNPYKEIDIRYKGMKRKIFRYLVGQARTGVVNRESSKSSIVKVLNEVKKGYRYLATQLKQAGILQDEDLIFFLQHHEIGKLVNTHNAAFVKLALQRKRLYEEQKNLTFNDIHFDRPVPEVIDLLSGAPGTELKGTPISRGMAEGKARVVKSIEDANQLQKGEIMVAAFTDIGWSPYYCKIEALITEVGSVLSHGAVVAREYTLPLVSNVKGATSIIKTGDKIMINGTTGVVKILETE